MSLLRSGAVILVFGVFLTACGGGGGSATPPPPPAPPPPLSSDATLSALEYTGGELAPAFDSSQLRYDTVVALTVTSTFVTPTANHPNATITVNGMPVSSGARSDRIILNESLPFADFIDIVVTAEDGTSTQTYTLILTRILFGQMAYIKASNTDSFDQFGGAFALSVNGTRLAVSAAFEDSGATSTNGDESDNTTSSAGAAYVFTRNTNGVWMQEAYIKASNAETDDRFGLAIDLSDDGSTLVVGALEDSMATGVNGDKADNSAGSSGAVYVYSRDAGGVWSEQAYLKASNTDAVDLFGQGAVALSGDGGTLVVGAQNEDSSATGVNGDETDNSANEAGAVYVFSRDGGGAWTQQGYIKASNTDAFDQFGGLAKNAIALSSDGDTLAVGTPDEDSAATGINGNETDNTLVDAGAVYVYTRDTGGVWTQVAYMKASNTGPGDVFGRNVSLSDDGAALAVGATGEDSGATGVMGDEADNGTGNAGAAYIYVRSSSGVWTQQAYVKASNPGAGDRFGQGLELSGDGSVLAIGAQLENSAAMGIDGDEADNTANDSGAVYFFSIN